MSSLFHCVFSGRRWFVLVDAAKACSTSPPDLSSYPADFVVLSFYKVLLREAVRKGCLRGGSVDDSVNC